VSARPTHGLGTFAGVFTPSILTILGLVLFLRTGYVVGGAGLIGALLIILAANLISVLTSISLSAIATNLRVRGGGDYYLISRTLGVEFGGALGIVLFLAQAVSVAFYAIGFAEIVSVLLGAEHAGAVRGIAWSALVFLAVPAWFGADWATRFQYAVMGVLFTAIVAFFVGGIVRFDPVLLTENLEPASDLGFWPLFAVFFPAVTGFTQGVSMSGDLEEPGRSLPLGTFLAVGVSLVVYVGAALVFAGALPTAILVDDPQAMRQIAPYTWLVDAGIIAATLSSALASLLGAPRVLQALAGDRVFRALDPFVVGYGESNNPRRGVVATLVIAAAVVALGNLNLVAAVVTMFFLISYGLLNYATYAEARGNSPYFRPRFRYFNAWLSLAGALACVGAMLAIHPLAGGVALALLFTIHQVLSRRVQDAPERFTASDRSHRLQRVRNELHALSAEKGTPRDWRPVVLAFSDDADRRKRLLDFAWWLEGRAGFTTLVTLAEGRDRQALREVEAREEALRTEIRDQNLDAFARVIMASDTRVALPVVLQSHGLGRIRPNTVMLNWFDHPELAEGSKRESYGRNLRTALLHHCNAIMLAATGPHFDRIQAMAPEARRIDVWFQNDPTGHLMLMLAYLMTRNEPWMDAPIRVLGAGGSRNPDQAREAVRRMLDEIRIAAEPVIVEALDPATIRRESADSAVVFLPFGLTSDANRRTPRWCSSPSGRPTGPVSRIGGTIEELIEGLPLTALVLAAEGVDLEADTEAEVPEVRRPRSPRRPKPRKTAPLAPSAQDGSGVGSTGQGWIANSARSASRMGAYRSRFSRPMAGFALPAISAARAIGAGQHLALARHLVDDLPRQRLRAAVAGAGHDHLVGGLLRKPPAQDRGHARVQPRAHVDLGHAEEAAVGAHDAPVVGQGDLPPRAEGMAVDRGHREGGEGEHPPHHRQHAVQVGLRLVAAFRQHPVEIQAVGVELAGAGGNERLGALGRLHLVERRVPRLHEVGMEAVLAVVHAQHEHGPVAFEIDHEASPITKPPRRAPGDATAPAAGGRAAAPGAARR
jgi:amino acid transporter